MVSYSEWLQLKYGSKGVMSCNRGREGLTVLQSVLSQGYMLHSMVNDITGAAAILLRWLVVGTIVPQSGIGRHISRRW
jgi:hypothetical protein